MWKRMRKASTFSRLEIIILWWDIAGTWWQNKTCQNLDSERKLTCYLLKGKMISGSILEAHEHLFWEHDCSFAKWKAISVIFISFVFFLIRNHANYIRNLRIGSFFQWQLCSNLVLETRRAINPEPFSLNLHCIFCFALKEIWNLWWKMLTKNALKPILWVSESK